MREHGVPIDLRNGNVLGAVREDPDIVGARNFSNAPLRRASAWNGFANESPAEIATRSGPLAGDLIWPRVAADSRTPSPFR
jgi:hypothetical protein